MKLLVDNQLPVALARFLTDNGFDCLHVQDVGMEASDDRDIWELAKSEQIVIVTKDEDFPLMADRQEVSSPQVLWSSNGELPEGSVARDVLCPSSRLAHSLGRRERGH